MSGVRELRRVLWTVLLTAGCGRIGFDGGAPDAPGGAVAELAVRLELAAECGVTTPASSTLAIRNTGASELVIEDAEVTGGFSVVTALPIVIAPGEEAALAIAPPAAVVGTDRGGDIKQGQLTLVTNEEGRPARTVSLSATIVGANVAFRSSGGEPLDLTFTATGGACPPLKELWVINEGTAQVAITAGSGTGLVSTFSSGVVAAGAGTSGALRATTNGPCSRAGSLTYVITGPSCTATPVVLSSTMDITGASTCFCS